MQDSDDGMRIFTVAWIKLELCTRNLDTTRRKIKLIVRIVGSPEEEDIEHDFNKECSMLIREICV